MTADPGPPEDARLGRVLVAAVGVTMTGSLPVWLTGALVVQIDRDFPVSATRLGLASGAFFGAAAIASAVAGRLAEHWGPRRAMRVAAGLSAAVHLAVAAASSYPGLLTALLVGGAANALAQVSANLIIARGVPAGRHGRSLAIKQAGVPAGTLVGGLAVPLLALTVGWRWAFVLGAIGAAGAGAVVPRVGGPVAPRGTPRRRPDLPVTLLVGLAVAVFFAAAANGTLATFLVSAGVETGFSESTAGLLLTLGSATGISMRLVAGFRADRRGGRHLPVVAVLLLGGAAGYLLLAPGSRLTHLAGTAVAFGFGWAWPGLFNLAVVRANPAAPAAATGITQTGVYLGALSGPVGFGLLVDGLGFGVAWTVAGVSSLLASGLVVVGRARIQRWRAAAPPSEGASRAALR